MKIIIIFFITIINLYSQKYSIDILGIHAADVEQIKSDSGSIIFKTQNRGIFDLVWPTTNYYEAKFNLDNFVIKSWGKKIKQGDYKTSQFCLIDTNNVLIYNDKIKIKTPKITHNIFSLLAMVQSYNADNLDTKWFNLEHEGLFGKARFVWADSSKIWNGDDSVLCDHYRLDISITDSLNKINKETDYFMKYIVNENFVREVWVSRTNSNNIIMAAKINTPWISVQAKINSLK